MSEFPDPSQDPFAENPADPVHAGSLLIATPKLLDPNFIQTVVLMCEHGSEGSLGLVVNRKLQLPLSHLLQRMEDLPEGCDPGADYGPVYYGGPVDTQRLLALRHTMTPSLGGNDRLIVEGVHLVNDLHATLRGISEESIHPSHVRFLLGYAGWGENQLAGELKEDAWAVRPANARLLFGTRTDMMWSTAMKMDGDSDMPSVPDPSMN